MNIVLNFGSTSPSQWATIGAAHVQKCTKETILVIKDMDTFFQILPNSVGQHVVHHLLHWNQTMFTAVNWPPFAVVNSFHERNFTGEDLNEWYGRPAKAS